MSRFVRPALLLLVLVGAAAIPSVAGADTAPAYIHGKVKLFGAPLKSSAKVVAVIGSEVCGTGDVKSGAFSVVVQSGCGNGSMVQFKLLFKEAKDDTPEDAYWASTAAIPFPGNGDRRKYDIDFPQLHSTSMTPLDGCVELTSTFANKTPVATIAPVLNPTQAGSIWRWDDGKKDWQGYIPNGVAKPILETLKNVNRDDTIYACYSPGTPTITITQPASPTSTAP